MHNFSKPYQIPRWGSITITIVTVLYAFAFVVLQCSPFWLDEWFIIYNLKYKTSVQLWGQLDLLQQFPRLYLQIIKGITAPFNYSFLSLRIPFLLVHTSGIVLCFALGKRLFKDDAIAFCIWLLVYVANPTSINYYFQVKQYTMEMLLALVAIGQLVYMLAVIGRRHIPLTIHACILASLIIGPFFSYTYPIVATPLFLVVILQLITGNNISKTIQRNIILLLTLLCVSIALAYWVDTQQVLHDTGMYNYWDAHFMHSMNPIQFVNNIYSSFANTGRGLFKPLIGISGLLALLLGTINSYKIITDKNRTEFDSLVLYSVMLVWLSVILFTLQLIPLDEYRLNAYKVAAHAILYIYLFRYFQKHLSPVLVLILSYTFVCVLAIFIIHPITLEIIGERHKKRLLIYRNTEKAILTAQANNLDIFTTRAPAYPHKSFDADFIIKSYPVFNPSIHTNIYNIDSSKAAAMIHSSNLLKPAIIIDADSCTLVK